MEAVQGAINELRNDLYNFANLVLTAVDQLAQAAMGGDNEAIQGYNNYYHKMQNSMGTIQNGIYQAQHQGLLNQLQPLYDNVNGLVMDCQNVATSGYLDEPTKNNIVGKYQQVDQFLQQCLTLAVPETPQQRPSSPNPPTPASNPPPRPVSQYGQPAYDPNAGYQQQDGYAPPRPGGPPTGPPTRPPSMYGVPPPGSPGAPGGPPNQPPSAAGGDPRASKSLTDFIGSENEYVKNLTIMINNYFKPMRTWSASNKKIVQETEVDAVFRPVEMIQQLHSQMLQRLQVASANPNGEKVGAIIKSLVTSLKVYTTYIQTLDSSIQILQRCKKVGKPFTSFLDDCKAKSGNNQDIEVLITIPQKRMTQYEVLIQTIIAATPPTHEDYAVLKEAQAEAKKLSEQMKVSKESAEGRSKLMEIQKKVGASLPQGMNLVAPHRFFVREGTMQYKNSEGKTPTKTNTCNVYAFNDIMVVTKSKGTFNKEEKVAAVCLFHECKVETAGGESRPAFRIMITKRNQILTFFPGDDAAKNSWFQEIKKHADETQRSRASGRGAEADGAAKSFMTKMLVRLVAGRNLVPCVYDPPDVYVLLVLGEATKKSSLKEKCRMDPQWDEKFLMVVKNPYEQMLQIEVRDKANDECLGLVQISLNDFYDYVENIGWRQLTVGTQSRGELLVGITLGPSFTNTAL